MEEASTSRSASSPGVTLVAEPAPTARPGSDRAGAGWRGAGGAEEEAVEDEIARDPKHGVGDKVGTVDDGGSVERPLAELVRPVAGAPYGEGREQKGDEGYRPKRHNLSP